MKDKELLDDMDAKDAKVENDIYVEDSKLEDDIEAEEDIESIFNNKKLKKNIRKAKIKTTIKTTLISIIVFIVVFIGGYIANIQICLKYSSEEYDKNELMVRLKVPNGYISESNDTLGILGGSGTYKIAKNIMGRPVILEDRVSVFGFNPPINSFTINSGPGKMGRGGNESLWENGYKKMKFFYTEAKDKEYQNDLNNIEKVPDGKVIEMAISFDRPYKINEIAKVSGTLKPAEINWLWLNEFTKESLESFKFETESYHKIANGISESNIIGMSYNSKDGFGEGAYNEKYDEIIEELSKSYHIPHKTLYKEIMERGKTKAEDAKILGVIVQGTKEDIQKLVGNPMIKASTFGVIVDPLY